jgi:hypothetical protein
VSNNKHNWKALEVRWLSTSKDTTLAQFAREVGVSRQVISEYAKKNHWVDKREKRQEVVETQILNNVTSYEVERRTKVAKRAMDLAEKVIDSKLKNMEEHPELLNNVKMKEVKELVEISDKLTGGTFKKGTVNLNFSGTMNEKSEDELIDIIESGGETYDG